MSLLLAILASATAFTDDPRNLPVGRLYFGRHHASAFLISNCEVMTAKHVLPKESAVVGLKGRFVVQGKALRGRVISIGDAVDPWSPGVDRDGDWAIVRLDRCAGPRIGHFDLLAGPFGDSPAFYQEVALAGFPDSQRVIRKSEGCTTRFVRKSGTIALRCQSFPGQSGSPVFYRRRDGRFVAVGITSAGDPLQYLTYLTPLPQTDEKEAGAHACPHLCSANGRQPNLGGNVAAQWGRGDERRPSKRP